MLCANFGCNWTSGSGEEDQNVKSLRQQQRQRQQQQRRTTFDEKSSLEPSAQVSYKVKKAILVSLCMWKTNYFMNSIHVHTKNKSKMILLKRCHEISNGQGAQTWSWTYYMKEIGKNGEKTHFCLSKILAVNMQKITFDMYIHIH